MFIVGAYNVVNVNARVYVSMYLCIYSSICILYVYLSIWQTYKYIIYACVCTIIIYIIQINIIIIYSSIGFLNADLLWDRYLPQLRCHIWPRSPVSTLLYVLERARCKGMSSTTLGSKSKLRDNTRISVMCACDRMTNFFFSTLSEECQVAPISVTWSYLLWRLSPGSTWRDCTWCHRWSPAQNRDVVGLSAMKRSTRHLARASLCTFLCRSTISRFLAGAKDQHLQGDYGWTMLCPLETDAGISVNYNGFKRPSRLPGHRLRSQPATLKSWQNKSRWKSGVVSVPAQGQTFKNALRIWSQSVQAKR